MLTEATATRYLDDPTLGERLRHDVRLMLGHAGRSAPQILGSPNDLKFRSCLTLFARAASNDDDRCLFKQALDQFHEGGPDPLGELLLDTFSLIAGPRSFVRAPSAVAVGGNAVRRGQREHYEGNSEGPRGWADILWHGRPSHEPGRERAEPLRGRWRGCEIQASPPFPGRGPVPAFSPFVRCVQSRSPIGLY